MGSVQVSVPPPSNLPDPSEVVLVVIPTEQIKKTPLMLEIEDMGTIVRVVRWGELVSMVLNDSRVSEQSKWMMMLGMTVPTSPDVSAAEEAESDIRLDRVDHLLPVIEPMIRVLSVPAMVQMVSTMAHAETDPDGHVTPESAAIVSRSVTEALRQSVISVVSSLVDLDLLLINEQQQPGARCVDPSHDHDGNEEDA
jgi:hypothetical protein